MVIEINIRTKRNLISWLVASIVMFTAFYIWHGIILNDFIRISYPVETYLTLAAIVYLVMGLGITLMYSFVEIKLKPIAKGIILGMIFGFFLYLITFVLGLSFYASPKLEYVFLDIAWQIFEQGIGGFIIGYVYAYYEKRIKFFAL